MYLAHWGRRIRIPLRIRPVTPWLSRRPQQIQSTHRHQNLTLSMEGKFTRWTQGSGLLENTIEEIQWEAEEEIAELNAWPGISTK
jgi:hypothetical protein